MIRKLVVLGMILSVFSCAAPVLAAPSISGGVAVEYEGVNTDDSWVFSENVFTRFSLRGDNYHVDVDITSDGAVMKRTYIAWEPIHDADIQLRAGNIRLPRGMASWTGFADSIHGSLPGFERTHDYGVSAHIFYGPAAWIVAIDHDSNIYARGTYALGSADTGWVHLGTHVYRPETGDMGYGAEIAAAYGAFATSAEYLPVSEHWYWALRWSVFGDSYEYNSSVISLPVAGALETSYRVAQVPDTRHSVMASYNVTDAFSVAVNYDWNENERVVTTGALYTF